MIMKKEKHKNIGQVKVYTQYSKGMIKSALHFRKFERSNQGVINITVTYLQPISSVRVPTALALTFAAGFTVHITRAALATARQFAGSGGGVTTPTAFSLVGRTSRSVDGLFKT